MWSGFRPLEFDASASIWDSVSWKQGDQKIRKNGQIFQKIAQKGGKSKKGQNIYNKPQNIYNKPCFETANLGEILINLLKQKVAQKVAIILGYFILSKNHNESPKVA